ncbi:MAG: hypothetical protein LM560_02695 [Desulfurococcaceae archaeon]|nr:hypothetical protein [Desulfurococcaceae archaeon]
MAVRVRVRVKSRSSGKSIVVRVLANGGAESPRPCIVVSEDIAESLGLWPTNNFKVHQVEEASSVGEVYVIEGAVELELLGEHDESLSRVVADLVVQKGLIESLITDITIDELGIQVISFSKGLWRFRDDPPDKVRRST